MKMAPQPAANIYVELTNDVFLEMLMKVIRGS
ncbi:Uncharacterised protein [Janthinobacterium lividum]|nr:Uncharacterised protein [Janthinobacterium lividum]